MTQHLQHENAETDQITAGNDRPALDCTELSLDEKLAADLGIASQTLPHRVAWQLTSDLASWDLHPPPPPETRTRPG